MRRLDECPRERTPLQPREFLQKLALALQTHESEDSEFFVRMFEHEFGEDPPWHRPQRPKDVAFVLSSQQLGPCEDGLGDKLMADFLLALSARQKHPKYLLLLSRGVYLAVQDGENLAPLQKLEALGTRIMVSKSSLEHYNQVEGLKVGEAVSTLQMVDVLYDSEKVIRL